jgi:cell division protein FtsN
VAHRDYKASDSRRNSPAKSSRKGGLVKGILLGVILSLLLAAGLLWLLWPRPQDFRKTVSAPILQVPVTSTAPEVKSADAGKPLTPVPAASSQSDSSNYTFYDILPGDKAPKPTPAKPKNDQWWLQVAALKSADDADALRAKLTLLNFNAVVEPTAKDNSALYRVRVGPFANQTATEVAQKKLAENKFEARPLKEAVTP